MTKSNAQKKRAKLGRKGLASSGVPRIVRAIENKMLSSAMSLAPKRKRKRNRAGKGTMLSNPSNFRLGNNDSIGPYRMVLPMREEFLYSVSSSVAFSNNQWLVNPGNNTTFPWLAPIAAKFERYRFRKLYFRFVSTSADAVGSTNTALGSYLMQANYDAADSAFVNLQQMIDYGGIDEKKPSVSSIFHVDCSGQQGGWMGSSAEKLVLVSTGSTATYPANTSIHDYDLARFQFGSEGAQAASVIGRLYVGYEIELIKPKLETPSGQSLIASHYITTPVTATSRFLSGVQQTGSTLSLTLAANTITIPTVGNFLVYMNFTAGTSYTDANAITAGTGGTLLTVWGGSGIADALTSASSGSGTTRFTYILLVSCTTAGVVLTYAGTPTIVGTTSCDLWVTQVSAAIVTLASEEKRIEELERIVRKLSLSYQDWGCQGSSDFDEKEPELPRASAKLSDSVVDLITSKLRK